MSEVDGFLRSLYIDEQGSVLRLENGSFRVMASEEEPENEVLSVQAIKIQQIIIFGACMVTPPAIRHCLINGITITLLSSRGDYYSRIEATNNVNIEIERLQFQYSLETDFPLACSRLFVGAKLHNSAVLLKRHIQNDNPGLLHHAATEIKRLAEHLDHATSIDMVRGYEGRGAAIYFSVFGHLLRREGFSFKQRIKRPPTDPVNAMLSFGYTLLLNTVFSMTRLHRLHPYIGFLHSDKPAHPALVSDLMEEFRSLIDGLVLSVINKHMIHPDQFSITRNDDGKPNGCYLDKEAKKIFLREYEYLMHRKTTHPATGYDVTYRRCLEMQAGEFARYLKEGRPYQPYLKR